MLPIERICHRCLEILGSLEALAADPSHASIRRIAKTQLDFNHITLWAIVSAWKSIN
jgi:hypothetical protein